jgi:anti-sigma B factor antagonist
MALPLNQKGRSMLSLDLSTRHSDGHVIVTLRGELDVFDAAGTAGALAAVTAREPRVIIDLAALEFIDSSGLAALVRARKHARHAGGDVLLAAPQQQVRRVLAVTRLLDVFSVYPSVEEAVCSAGFSRQVAATAATGRPAVRHMIAMPGSALADPAG